MAAGTDEAGVDTAATVAEMWHVPSVRKAPRGWPVFSLDYVLAMLQGNAAEPHLVRRGAAWNVIGAIVLGIMCVAQALCMMLAWIPVVSTLFEVAARMMPGSAAGFFMRACYWKAKLKHLGQNAIIDQYVDIRGPGSVSIGSHSHLDAYVRLKAGERGYGQHGSIEIGDYVHLGPGVLIVGRGGVKIGNLASLSADARVYSATNTIEHPADPGRLISMSHVAPAGDQHIIERPVVIEEYAFVGMMTCILPGVRVGRAAVVHSNLELTRDVPPFANIGGLPRGRQIGWRRPRCKSPALEGRDASAEEGNEPDA